MLTIHVKTHNEFYKKGITELIKTLSAHSSTLKNIRFSDRRDINDCSNVMITDTAIIVNIFDTPQKMQNLKPPSKCHIKARVFIPLNVQGLFSSEILMILRKMLKIAVLTYSNNFAAKIYKEVEEPKSLQITEKEADVIRLTGMGYSTAVIANKLGQTAPQTATQRRNAVRKLRMLSRIHLFKFSSAIKSYFVGENVFLYL